MTRQRSPGNGHQGGADFHPIPLHQSDLADHFADAIGQAETLCNNAHGVAKYLLSRAVRDAGYKVVLTGEGSDEILGGYAFFRRDMLLYNREGQDPTVVADLLDELTRLNPVSRGLLLPDGEAGQLDMVKRLLGFVPSWIETFSARSQKMRALLAEDFVERFGERENFRAFFNDIDVRGQLSGREPLNQSLYLWAKAGLPAYILDHAGRSHGNGAFDRRARAIPRSPPGRSHPLTAGLSEDPWHD